jgi:hypothetical protein
MLSKVLKIGAIALVGVLVLGAVAVWVLPTPVQAAYGRPRSAPPGSTVADPPRAALLGAGTSANDLSESEIQALSMALDDEYRAWAVYDQVIADLGAVQPFTSIQKAEEAHIAALVTLFDRYGLDVPANDYVGTIPTFDTWAGACETGVQAELDNAGLYDQLLSMVDNPDIVQVFTSLQQASQTRHLPAFERCAP